MLEVLDLAPHLGSKGAVYLWPQMSWVKEAMSKVVTQHVAVMMVVVWQEMYQGRGKVVCAKGNV